MLSLRTKVVLSNMLSCLLAAMAGALVWLTLGDNSLWLAVLLMLAVCYFCSMWLTKRLSDSLQALEIGLLNFKDNDFSVSLHPYGEPQLDALVSLYNQASAKLRSERQFIYQRELMLDKVIQNSPNVMLLVDDSQRVIYANGAARHLFNHGVKVEGMLLPELIAILPEALKTALNSEQEGLFSMGSSSGDSIDENDVETWHISRGRFTQNNQQHHLILLKQLTKELNRQEVAVWKKVIRIISHELNNSVAPIASMVNSGRFLTQHLDNTKLQLIFDTIENRTSHLSQFISHYAQFAKLPLPQKQLIDWPKITQQLAQQYPFQVLSALPQIPIKLDSVQLEQVLINLLKNAHESGADADTVALIFEDITHPVAGLLIKVNDQGSGMSSEVLSQALLPFYSTKQSGTGIGLPLCREIIEAHGGRISLQSRPEGGLSVKVWLPAQQS
ncbi:MULTISPECIES: ATP-binding protein [Shewanella]|uniref:sensor histidine kinase n=1 Tax=Shewanella TaxID=22 RepID=UPI000C490D89|nr:MULTISPECIES: ATP-binding protein [Shewanella]NCQ46298.1 PAS domain-containing protein [Shewanella frigidimarina]NCO72798.1 PAS domain-containing protein [Shewanella vesiculosa]NCP37910.1 PAS domain-containing protein [Shewanella vesiculosa]NCP70222.1 PAS domain-containing protein [Shewanella vesiculosa]NCP75633.1 PAS domain-containing protein [Shewanella vesiculosa]